MKRSKLLLGMTTCILAVVALVALKSTSFTTKSPGYYAGPSGACTLACGASFFTASHGNAATCGQPPHPAYSYNATGCAHRLYTKAGTLPNN